jgi:hypothetical protein
MDKNDELNKSLVVLLKMFKNRPYHLAKYLIDNSALNSDFIKKITNSDKLKKLSDDNQSDKPIVPVYFVNISQMNEFYDSFIDDIGQISKEKSLEELTKDINQKLDNLIKDERFEEATRVRDYMVRNGIKRLNNFN